MSLLQRITSRKIRTGLIAANIAIVWLLVWCLSPLITLLWKNSELFRPQPPFANDDQPKPGAFNSSGRPENTFPRILHQTYATEQIPDKWKALHESCKREYADFEYMLWTDDKARKFLSDHYPWFVQYWDSYAFPIQRADSIRYFALYHFGGVYLDMDIWCNKTFPVNELQPDASGHTSVFKVTQPTGVTNDLMMSTARHPVFADAIARLPKFHRLTRFWARLQPYANVMISSGPLFLTLVLERSMLKHASLPSPATHIVNKAALDPYFTNLGSGSWHRADAKALLWLGSRPWTWFALGLFGPLLALWLTGRIIVLFDRATRRDEPATEEEDKLMKMA